MSRTLIVKHELGTLVLEVHSHLQHVEPKSFIPFWETLNKTGLTGLFQLNITRKVTGVNSAFPAVTKICASDNIARTIWIKSQGGPDSCYGGNLFQPRTTMSAGIIREKLVETAGAGWFDPNHPSLKKMPPSAEPEPLVHVDDKIKPATDAKLRSVGRVSDPSAKGYSRDPLQIELLLIQFAEESDAGIITSDKIAKIVMEQVPGVSGEQQKRGYASMIMAWVELGYLERASKAKKAVPYKITQKAIEKYSLVIPAAKVMSIQQAVEVDYEQLVATLDPETLNEMLQEAREKAKMLINLRTKINELVEQRKTISKEINLLKYGAKDSLLNASLKLIGKLPKV